MFKRIKKLALLAVLLVGVLGSSGCFILLVGAAAGAGGYAWVNGALVKEFNVSASRLHDYTLRALKDLQLPVHKDDHDRISAKISSSFSDGAEISINIEAITEHTARIKLRVGVLGDKTRSEMIFSAIQKRL